MKKTVMLLVCALLLMAAVLPLGGCDGDSKYKDYMVRIDPYDSNIGNLIVRNYTAVIKNDTDWKGLTEDQRAGIARYCVKQALKKAEEEKITDYNILGTLTPAGAGADPNSTGEAIDIPILGLTQTCFMYNAEKAQAVIYVDNAPVGEVEVG
ncbi:MAG: hypothetical protein LBD12_06025 [Clostridiales Family XIII bacterium]|jgi:hypothetical protein|nr:hypothetical protein [Clostridiales Family XIII bacterium]